MRRLKQGIQRILDRAGQPTPFFQLGPLRLRASSVYALALALVAVAPAACKQKGKEGQAQKAEPVAQKPEAQPLAASKSNQEAPARIVSLGGGVSETIAALGRLDAIVGIDSTSLYPESLGKLPKVGYFRSFSPEGVVSLKPDLVIGSDGVGPQSAVGVLRSAGLNFVELMDVKTLDDVLARTLKIGEAIGRVDKAKGLVQSLEADFKKIREEHHSLPSKRLRCLFVYARGAGMMLVGGNNTSADAVMKLAGLENAAASIKEFGPLSAEGLVTFKPDIILIPKRGLASIGGMDGLLAVPGVAATPAGKQRRIITMDDSRFLAMGPRTPQVARDLMNKAYRTAPAK